MSEAREVKVSELLEAGDEGRGLLDLITKTDTKIMTDTVQQRLLSTASDPQNGMNVDVEYVWLENRTICRITVDGGGELKESGFSAGNRGGVPQALKKLFNYYTKPGSVIQVKPANEEEKYFRYELSGFQQIYKLSR